MAILKIKRRVFYLSFFYVCLLQLFLFQPAYADFINGGFEDPYTPSNANTFNPITGWTLTGYTFNGATVTPPTSLSDINLNNTLTPGGFTDILNGATQTLFDYFLAGATPTPTLLLPVSSSQSVMVNLRSIDQPLAKSGSSAISGWTATAQQATAISQQITVQSSDIDPKDNTVHIRFKLAPVLQNPSHTADQQPFVAVQVNNITTGRTGANPLFFQWNYAAQPGVPWNSLTARGTNPGSASTYQYTNWQAFDIAPGNAFIHIGDVIELVILASGCAPGGHDGHAYVDDVHTYIPPSLWISASGPSSTSPGSNVTYTYTYINSGSVTENGVQAVINLPQQGNPSSLPAPSTTFVSVTNPTVGTSPSCTGSGPITCNIGTLQPGETGTFQLTVNVPSGWATSTGPVNNGNYPISASGISALLGPLVQTTLVSTSNLSNMIADVSGLPTSATVGISYSGSFTCANNSTATATGSATNASCSITNLPTGLSVSGCTISPSNATWSEPATIPANATVTCSVTGTPSASGTFNAALTTNASNNSNSTNNTASASIVVSSGGGSSYDIPATLNGSPAFDPVILCCGRPLILGPLPVPGPGPTTYTISEQTGNINCQINYTSSQTYLKVRGTSGHCTIIASKNGIVSNPLTVTTP